MRRRRFVFGLAALPLVAGSALAADAKVRVTLIRWPYT